MTMKPDFKMGGYEGLFHVEDHKRIVKLPLTELHQHPGLKVAVREDAYLQELAESIQKNGLLEDVRAFPDPEGGYWIISGRHRCAAAKLAGLSEVSVILDDSMTAEQAEIAITDCNLRHELGTMEKAWTYRIKREAETRQGYRSDLYGKAEPQADKPTESERTIQRYVRLTYLVPELQKMADQNVLKVRTGAALSYLPCSLQKRIAFWIKDYDKIPDMKIAEEWKLLQEDLTEDDVLQWFMQEEQPKGKSISVSLPYSKFAAAIPAGYGKKQVTELVQELLTKWAKKNEVVSDDPHPELKIGEFIDKHGKLLAWDELRIGMKVLIDSSTGSQEWFKVAQVEKLVQLTDGESRVILPDGSRSRSYINRSHIDNGTVKLYRPIEENVSDIESRADEMRSALNSNCTTGLSPTGHCGAAHYCDQPYDCCQNCSEECNMRCGWIEK